MTDSQNAPYAPPYAPYGTTPYGAPLVPRTNTLAIIALVLALTVPIGGIICGHMALGQIKRTGESGHGLALAGAIIGWVYTGFIVLYLIFVFVVIFASMGVAGVSTLVT
ncbi:MAG: DUF4190 domain-containing protein [Pseudolysinimonas sp.]